MPFDVVSYALAKKKLNWLDIKQKMESEGVLNKQYDTNADGIIDATKIDDLQRDKIIDLFNSPFWNNIPDKPSTFPPSSHTHTRSNISDLFNSPFWNNIPDKPSTYPPSSHTHTRSNISDLFSSPFWNNIPDKPSTFPPSSHTHNASQISSGRLSLSRLPTSSTANRFLVVRTANANPSFDALTANDIPSISRSKITDFFSGPFWVNIPDKPTSYPPDPHQHERSDIPNLFSSPFWNNIPDKPSTYPPSSHTHSVNDIPTIPRTKLEYPTENVSFAYLSAINKLQYSSYRDFGGIVVTLDAFTDKAVEAVTNTGRFATVYARHQNKDNFYLSQLNYLASTSDHFLKIMNGGSESIIATESVNIDTTGEILCISCSGSTIKSLRYRLVSPKQSIANVTATGTISATNTNFTSGSFGIRPMEVTSPHGYCDTTTARLIAPQSRLPLAQRIIEIDVTNDDTVRPNFKQNLIEISKLTNIPDFLRKEAKRYELLKAKGFTDEEIELLLGYIPQHQVDLASVTWGAFDYKGEPTMLAVITGDNPYQSGAILEQENHAKSKNLRVFKPPRDLTEAKELHAQIKQDRPDIIAGKDNLAYQTIGDENLEPLAVADFYDGFTQGIYNMKDLEKVPEWELERTINMWQDRLKRSNITATEKNKHMKKLKGVLKS